ncbi:hypothetical protein VNI00_002611 [Paramarasmius palmivorus]|uniref:Uncharacterized protein n=1 Tax=Paramarasmius palmivorus TaxID=297713 RepID=A0AAW0DZQ8_9AGAR
MSESLSVPSNVVADSSMGDSSTPGPSSQSASDPTLSLRAVALSTLKSKRRKPASTQSQTPTLPPRSVLADNSVQLDYGQDDQDASSSAVKPPANSAQHGPEDDGQPREEGEISDSEEAQLALAASGQQKASVEAPPPSPPKLPQASPSVDARSGNTTSPTTASLKQEPSPPPSNLLERISGPEPPVSSSNAHRRDSSISSTVVDDMDVDQPPHNPHIVDENHVRPGLLMNQKQYDAAKDIILDLLGWGVPPSYLLDCGLSREIVFYVFTELNLRLPDGINPNDFVPYNPTTVAMLVRGVNVPPGGLPNLPRKSISLTNGHLATSHMSPMSPSMLPSPDVSNLNDMEKLRRQELLARKAVHASRKGKGARSESSLMTPSTSHNRDVEMASTAIPTETVDDFLKTIDPVDETPRTQPGNDDRMDVDTSVHQTEDPLQNNYSPIETPSSAEAQHMDFDPPSRRSSSSASSGGTQRRTGKRPVAADFVDFESGPRHRNGHPHPHLKRKQEGSFASISTTRRCVIDLSDDEDGVQDDQSHFNSRTSGYNTPGLMVPTTKAEGTGFNTPPVSTASSTPRTMSPGALAEKEKEIARMRQMIAERERIAKGIKFKKINTQTSVDDGNDDAHTLASATTVSVKQEEGDVPLHSAKTNDADTMVIDTSNGTTELPKESMDGDPDRDSEASSTASTPPPIG